MSTENKPTPVVSVEDFIRKWGTKGWSFPIEKFIADAPSFPKEKELAGIIGEISADLETALTNYKR